MTPGVDENNNVVATLFKTGVVNVKVETKVVAIATTTSVVDPMIFILIKVLLLSGINIDCI